MTGGKVLATGQAGFVGIAKFGPFLGWLARNRGLRAVIGPFEQGIALQFLFDERRQVEIGQLKQLDRLHQLRRHHQRLGLAEL
jgi:hypothetical protein